VYTAIAEEVGGNSKLSAQELCRTSGVSRSGYYRRREESEPEDRETMDLRQAMQEVALEMPAYGYRRITRELQQRGWKVNHKHVLRLMREDNLLCLRRRKWVRTTDSQHGLPIYPNLAAGLVPTGVDQLWVADITYIRLQSEFVYLAVVIDAYSRRVVGWNLGRTLQTELPLEALQQALKQRKPGPGLVHHSDRGVQYASYAYTDLLQQHQATISMSRKGNPYDNAFAESFIKTLKQEEVHRYEYLDLEEAQQRIERFMEAIYNRKRLHSALAYVSPVQFEAQLGTIGREVQA
jgi:putative transposase